MSGALRITEEELGAYLDGELLPPRATELEAALQTDPALVARLAALAEDQERLSRTYAPLGALDLPEAWRARIAEATGGTAPSPHRGARRVPPRAIALAAAACVALVLGAVVRPDRTGPGAAPDALIAEALAAGARTRPATPSGLPRIAGIVPRAPDLSARGWRLSGTRVDSAAPAVQFTYTDAAGRRFALYVRPSPGAPRFEMTLRGDTRICIWQDDAITAVMTGALPASEMMRLATAAYAALGA